MVSNRLEPEELSPETMEPGRERKPPSKLNKTRRGRGKHNQKGGNYDGKFSIWGSNSNGLKAKLNSLKANIEYYKKPSCITIQETKLRQTSTVQIKGYKVFEKVRAGYGGGILTAVIDELEPVLISDGDDENDNAAPQPSPEIPPPP